MDEPFLGSRARAAGAITRHELRRRYVAVHRDVYVVRDTELTPILRAKACWLRSRGRGILASHSAAALYGAKWIDPGLPAAIIDTNRRRIAGVNVWEERIEADEIAVVEGMRITTPARTALDLARRHRPKHIWIWARRTSRSLWSMTETGTGPVRAQYVRDIRRLEMLQRRGWLVVRVIAEDHPDDIVRRVREARARRA
nr:type IV toxin-antitoxin system AbiEi family antitoxin [Mycobacterium tilburgii]